MIRVSTDELLDARAAAATTVDSPWPPAMAGHDGHRTLIYFFGEHDLTNRAAVAALIDQTTTFDDTDVEIDLSRLRYMSSATVHLILEAREQLQRQSRSLSLLAPSPIARRLLDLCGVVA
jgi:anti-anti-sigma factor